MEKIRLLLFEENQLLRDSIVSMISKLPDLKIVAAMGNNPVMQKARELKPDVVLLRPNLPAAEKFIKALSRSRVVVIDLVPDQVDILDFVKAGVSGFISRNATFDDHVKTIRAVAQGEKVLPRSLTEPLFSQITGQETTIDAGALPGLVRLTHRQQQIVRMIADGLSNKQIAAHFHVSINTVKTHVHSILQKLSLETRLEIAAYAHAKANSASFPPALAEERPQPGGMMS